MSLDTFFRTLIQEELAKFHGTSGNSDAVVDKPPKAPKAQKTAAASATTASTPAATPAPPAPTPAAPAAAEDKGVQAQIVNIKMASDAMLEVAAKKGRDAAIELMKRFGVSKAGELKPAQYGDFYNTAKAIVSEQTANADLLG